MSFVKSVQRLLVAHRERTLELITAIEQLPDPQAAISWQPGPGRAHIGWQLMHIGITEELFATERLSNTQPGFPEYRERFQRGSSPDDRVPPVAEIRSVLSQSREHLLATLSQLSDDDLQTIPAGLAARGWTLEKALQIVCWHEPHHQGQAHITLNLFKNRA